MDENASSGGAIAYRLHNNLALGGDLNGKKLCFDSKGTPFLGGHSGTEITVRNVLNVQYRNEEVNITIEPKTGYVIIER